VIGETALNYEETGTCEASTEPITKVIGEERLDIVHGHGFGASTEPITKVIGEDDKFTQAAAEAAELQRSRSPK
jgi:hypothetical protein